MGKQLALPLDKPPYPQYYYAISNNSYWKVESETVCKRIQLWKHNGKFHYCFETFDASLLNHFGGNKYACVITEEEWLKAVEWYLTYTQEQLQKLSYRNHRS